MLNAPTSVKSHAVVIDRRSTDTTHAMAYRATFGSLLASCLLLGGALYGLSGCEESMSCTDQGCAPTYELELESMNPELEPGLWHVALQVDGLSIEADCTVSSEDSTFPEFTPCEVGAWGTEPERSLEVSVHVGQSVAPGSGEPTDTGDVPQLGNQAIFVSVTSNDETPPVAVLDVTAQHEGVTMLEIQRAPTHEIDTDYWGPGCGSCPLDVSETVSLP